MELFGILDGHNFAGTYIPLYLYRSSVIFLYRYFLDVTVVSASESCFGNGHRGLLLALGIQAHTRLCMCSNTHMHCDIAILTVKDKDQLWSCDCIVIETLWNRSENVDHLAL